MTVNFVCVRVGDRYAPEYVTVLFDMVARNSTLLEGVVRFWCVTDRPEECPEGVTPIPADPSIPPSWWAKLQLFSPAIPWGEGERVVYFGDGLGPRRAPGHLGHLFHGAGRDQSGLSPGDR
jgi:hypothetical protein